MTLFPVSILKLESHLSHCLWSWKIASSVGSPLRERKRSCSVVSDSATPWTIAYTGYRDQTQVSYIAVRRFTVWVTREAPGVHHCPTRNQFPENELLILLVEINSKNKIRRTLLLPKAFSVCSSPITPCFWMPKSVLSNAASTIHMKLLCISGMTGLKLKWTVGVKINTGVWRLSKKTM